MKTTLKTFLELIRIKQSIGSLLLILPCFFAIALIYKTNANLDFSKIIFTTILFTIGAFLTRSAGCIINDLLDKNFDKKVERTKNRPLASQKISSKMALFFLAILLFLSLIILLQFNYQTIVGGFVALGLITTYPLMKRITYFPQIFLGITFNFGIIMAGLALNSSINFGLIILYLACISWTLLYDTVYGFQDIEDDLRIGIKSSSIIFSKKNSNNPKKSLYKISVITTLFFIMLGVYEELSLSYFLVIIFSGFLVLYKILKCDLKKPEKCLKFFKENLWFGLVFLTAILCS
jgi:4-hydroxybenzoate polyprenyl transferase